MRKRLQSIGLLFMMLMATLAVNAEPVTAQWDFKNNLPQGIQESTNYEGMMAIMPSTVEGIFLRVDAVNGKLYCVGRNNAQMNPGTFLQVPVFSTEDVVTVEGYPDYCHFAVAGQQNGSKNTISHTATAEEVKKGYVEVKATEGNNYINSVSVQIHKMPTIGTWDYANSRIMNETMAIPATESKEGTVEAIEGNGLLMTVASNGASFRDNGKNIQVATGAVFKVPVKSVGDEVIVYGYIDYSYYTIGSSTEEITNSKSKPFTSYRATSSDVKQGYVAITSKNNNNYFLKIIVVQKPEDESQVSKNVTATFPFNLGTEGQTADFGDAADLFLNSKVLYGNGLQLKDANSGAGIDETRFEPYSQNDSPDATNLIQFTIQPKFGLTFTPTKVSFKTTRFGTDNGLLDVAWLNPDGSTVTLATEVKPNRNNGDKPAIASEAGKKYSDLSYEVKGATPGEGVCGLLINLYKLQNGKQIGFADIVIEGVVNGQIVSVPMLASFTANGVDYSADDVFEADGDNYKATIELSKSETMISANNPLKNVEALSGELGDITYNGDETGCVATIPVSLGDITINYIVNFVQKPDFTLTYVNTDGSKMATQAVEKDATIGKFDVDFNDAIAEEGYKVRGWFEKKSGGRKYTTDEVITKDISLYAVATEIEVPHDFKKYDFNLTDVYFYPEDHEGFVSTGSGYWHDVQHGWAFKNGDVIKLLVGKKANIFVTNCQYSASNAQLVFKDADGNEVGRIAGKGEGDGQIEVFAYEGAAGDLFMEIESAGAVYIHDIKIVNTSTTNYQQEGRWFFVKQGDASSLLDVIDVVSGTNSSADSERSYIFIPDGMYDLGETVLTAISGHNISIIGQSTEGTIIKNAPDVSTEGIGTTAVLLNSSQNLYMQDLTLQNALDYYAAGSAGRAVCFQDKGNRAILKNVAMLSYQDTYYSQNTKQSYWEDCDIHGTVDFICGGGDVRFVNTTLSLEPRSKNGSGGRTITAPTTTTDFGYVFDGCKVVDLAEGKGDWNFGRTWQNNPICIYLNTTLDKNSANTLVASRWTQKGMNNKDPKVFGEFNTMDESGNNITPSSNTITSYGGQFQTILSAEAAEAYAYDKMFTDWDPAALTLQEEAPKATYADGQLSWQPVKGAIAYAIFKNDIFQSIVTDETTLSITAEEGDVLTIRSANSMGGFGEAATVEVVKEVVMTLDENAVNKIPAMGTKVNTVNTVRTLVGGNWNTICLPFGFTADELSQKDHPFYGAQIMQLSGATYNQAANAENIDFEAVSSMEAGKPYVIKVNADVVNPTFQNVEIGAVEPQIVEAGNCTMKGIINPLTFATADKGVFFLSAGNKFSYVGEPGTMKGMRAFFEIAGLPEEAYSNVAMTFSGVDGIRYVGVTTTDGKIYDLQGRQLNGTPQKGVYIQNGHKYVK